MNPIPVTYFDTEKREMRTISLSAQRVAYAEGPQEVVARSADGTGVALTAESPGNLVLPYWATTTSLIVGIIAGLFWLLWSWQGAGFSMPKWLKRDPVRAALRRAVRSGDASGVWRVGRKLAPASENLKAFPKLDAALFGDGPMPNLDEVAREVSAKQPG